jgi:hypothetical protein
VWWDLSLGMFCYSLSLNVLYIFISQILYYVEAFNNLKETKIQTFYKGKNIEFEKIAKLYW